MIDTLKFPSGEFTHSELATANGKTNQQVWTAYQKAIKDGIIVSAGERPNSSGKGKPSRIWKVADGVPVPIVTIPAVQSEPRFTRIPKLVVVAEATEATVAPIVEAKLASVKPATSPKPVQTEATEMDNLDALAEKRGLNEPAEPVIKPIRNLTGQVVQIEAVCPFCNTKLNSVEVETGVKVWCPINDLSICSCSENPYGVANNVKNAVEILHDKFFKHRIVKA